MKYLLYLSACLILISCSRSQNNSKIDNFTDYVNTSDTGYAIITGGNRNLDITHYPLRENVFFDIRNARIINSNHSSILFGNSSTIEGNYSTIIFSNGGTVEGNYSHIFGGEGCHVMFDSVYCICDFNGSCIKEFKVKFTPLDTVKVEGETGLWLIAKNTDSNRYVIHDDNKLAYFCIKINSTGSNFYYPSWFLEEKIKKYE